MREAKRRSVRRALRGLLICLVGFTLAGCSSAKSPATAVDWVAFEAATTNRYVRADVRARSVGKLTIASKKQDTEERPAVNVALVIDTSGSMKGNAIARAREAGQKMVDALRDEDRLAIVTFDSKPEVLLESESIGDLGRKAIREKLAGMKARGTTDLEGGLRAGLKQVLSEMDPKAINRIVLLGDGVPNDGQRDIQSLAMRAGKRGVTITAFGLGTEYDETLMGKIAQLSGGRFRFVDSPDKVAAFFGQEVLRMDGIYARNAVVELVPGPGVRIIDVVGQRVQRRGAVVSVRLGDLNRDSPRSLVVRAETTAHRDGASVELYDAVLRFRDPADGGKQRERRLYVGAEATASTESFEAGRDRALEDATASVEAAATTVRAIELNRQGQPEQAQKLIREATQRVEKQAEAHDNPKLAEEAKKLRDLGKQLADTPKRPTPKPAPRAPRPSKMAPPAAAPIAPSPAEARAPRPRPRPAARRKIRAAHDEAMQQF